MVTFLSGGTGTPKLLRGANETFPPAETTVVCNTGDDVELGGHLVCPDVDTVLFLGGDELDLDTWWGIADDATVTDDELHRLADAADLDGGPRYLPDERQTAGDPVASIVHTPEGPMHFQAFWVGHDGDPAVESVEFRGGADAFATDAVLTALSEPVVVGPSNPITSIGPMLAVDGIEAALRETPVVAVSPFVEEQVFSGPAAKLMAADGYDPSTTGVAEAYDFADAFVLDSEDGTELDRPVVRTDTRLDTEADAQRVAEAVQEALEVVS